MTLFLLPLPTSPFHFYVLPSPPNISLFYCKFDILPGPSRDLFFLWHELGLQISTLIPPSYLFVSVKNLYIFFPFPGPIFFLIFLSDISPLLPFISVYLTYRFHGCVSAYSLPLLVLPIPPLYLLISGRHRPLSLWLPCSLKLPLLLRDLTHWLIPLRLPPSATSSSSFSLVSPPIVSIPSLTSFILFLCCYSSFFGASPPLSQLILFVSIHLSIFKFFLFYFLLFLFFSNVCFLLRCFPPLLSGSFLFCAFVPFWIFVFPFSFVLFFLFSPLPPFCLVFSFSCIPPPPRGLVLCLRGSLFFYSFPPLFFCALPGPNLCWSSLCLVLFAFFVFFPFFVFFLFSPLYLFSPCLSWLFTFFFSGCDYPGYHSPSLLFFFVSLFQDYFYGTSPPRSLLPPFVWDPHNLHCVPLLPPFSFPLFSPFFFPFFSLPPPKLASPFPTSVFSHLFISALPLFSSPFAPLTTFFSLPVSLVIYFLVHHLLLRFFISIPFSLTFIVRVYTFLPLFALFIFFSVLFPPPLSFHYTHLPPCVFLQCFSVLSSPLFLFLKQPHLFLASDSFPFVVFCPCKYSFIPLLLFSPHPVFACPSFDNMVCPFWSHYLLVHPFFYFP